MYIHVYTNNVLLKRLIEKLKKSKINYAIAGGYAVALHGAVRGTLDIDLLVELNTENLKNIEKAMHELGLTSRLPIDANEIAMFRIEFIEKRNLKVWTFQNLSMPTEIIDILINYDLKDFRITSKRSMFGSINIVNIDDLIKMKREAGRPQDVADIEALEKIKARI